MQIGEALCGGDGGEGKRRDAGGMLSFPEPKFSGQNAPKSVLRPGSAQIRWGMLGIL